MDKRTLLRYGFQWATGRLTTPQFYELVKYTCPKALPIVRISLDLETELTYRLKKISEPCSVSSIQEI